MDLSSLLTLLSSQGDTWISAVVVGIVGVLSVFNIVQQTFDNKKQSKALNEIIEIERQARALVTEELKRTSEDLVEARKAIRALRKDLEKCYGSKETESE